jgi:hypothetical protein
VELAARAPRRSAAQDGASPAAEERAPYLGLAPFTAAEAELYVGREAEAQAFVNRLRVAPLLAVVGPSGAGKSSFVHAGVVPILPEGWRVATLRPGTDPWVSLTSRGEVDLLVVDQLEELFTLGASAEEQERFAVRLAAAARVVVTLRDDFLMRARELPALGDRLAQGLVLLSTPGEGDLARMVSEPARRAGYDFDDPDLPGEMARAVAGRPGALALLSFTAARLWEQRDRAFRRLSRRAYDAMGGVAGALATHAEQTLAELPPGERALVRQAFRRLVTVEGTRAVVARAELEQALGPRAGNVIERLVEARLLVATENEGGAEHIEIIHEALLTAWPRLAAWRREDESGARLRAQLGIAARQWHERGRARGLLWRDEALTELQRWRRAGGEPLTTVEQDFAGASLAEAARGRRRRTLALAVILAALGAGIAVLGWMNARTEEQRREAQARLAQLHEEQGRQAVLAAQPGQALAYLAEAQRLGRASSAGRYLVAESLRMMDAQVAELRGHTGTIWSIAFSPDGNRLVTAGDDGTARVFDTTGRSLAILRHEGPVWRASFSPDGTRVATASHDGTAGIWDAATGVRPPHAAPRGARHHRALEPRRKPAGHRQPRRHRGIWDTTTGARLASLGGEGGTAVLISRFSPDGNRLVTATADGALQLWTPGGERLARVEAHAGFGILYLGFSPTGGASPPAATTAAPRSGKPPILHRSPGWWGTSNASGPSTSRPTATPSSPPALTGRSRSGAWSGRPSR